MHSCRGKGVKRETANDDDDSDYSDSDEDDSDSDDDFDINVWPYFSASCYSGPEDGETGFYTVYRDLFSQIRDREIEYSSFNHKSGGSKQRSAAELAEEFANSIPLFGDSTSSEEEVAAFYAFWQNFSSCLSFANADKHNTNEEGLPRYLKRYVL